MGGKNDIVSPTLIKRTIPFGGFLMAGGTLKNHSFFGNVFSISHPSWGPPLMEFPSFSSMISCKKKHVHLVRGFSIAGG